MIQTQTILEIADNSGARKVMCIKVTWWLEKKIRSSWGHYQGCHKRSYSNWKSKKGQVAEAVVVRTKKDIKREDGSSIRF